MSQEKSIKKKTRADLPAKPFLKWAGGKGQLLDTFQNFYPAELRAGEIENYYEPFVGGGAVFFDIAQRFNIGSAFLYDNNQDLILTYLTIQKNVDGLIDCMERYKNQYLKRDEIKRTEFYYKIREKFNALQPEINYNRFSKKWIERAAQIIFLNRTCFNGLFRFNSKGEFNVPEGRYKNPRILNEENLRKVSELLAIAEIKRVDFRELQKKVKGRSFIYYDPPYRPLNQTSSFTAYSREAFGDPEQKALAALFLKLDKKGALQMLSNSDPKNHNPEDNFFDDLYQGFPIVRVPARRNINSNAAKRTPINEIIVTNYPVEKPKL